MQHTDKIIADITGVPLDLGAGRQLGFDLIGDNHNSMAVLGCELVLFAFGKKIFQADFGDFKRKGLRISRVEIRDA